MFFNGFKNLSRIPLAHLIQVQVPLNQHWLYLAARRADFGPPPNPPTVPSPVNISFQRPQIAFSSHIRQNSIRQCSVLITVCRNEQPRKEGKVHRTSSVLFLESGADKWNSPASEPLVMSQRDSHPRGSKLGIVPHELLKSNQNSDEQSC